MELIISVIASVAFVFLFRKLIKKYPIVFYVLAVLIDVLFLSGVLFDASRDIAVVGYPYVARCLVGFGFFVIVMYIGVLSEKNRIRQMLMPIRGELSVIACILTLGHVVNYLGSYIADILDGFFGMSIAMISSFVVSGILLVLLIPLAITSFNFVKSRMKPNSWKKLQKWAYLFYAFLYLHIMLMLVPTLSAVGQRAMISIVAYTVIFALYAVLRIRKAMVDKRARSSKLASEST